MPANNDEPDPFERMIARTEAIRTAEEIVRETEAMFPNPSAVPSPVPPPSSTRPDVEEDFRDSASYYNEPKCMAIGWDRKIIACEARHGHFFGEDKYYIDPYATLGSWKEAAVFTLREAWNRLSFNKNMILVFLKEKPLPPGCKLEMYFDEDFVSLMKDAPNNKVLRAHMMRILKHEPAVELDTFDKLKEWIESTFPKRTPMRPPVKKNPAFTAIQPPQRYANIPAADLQDIQVTDGESYMEVDARYSASCTGRCQYTHTKSTRFQGKINMDMIRGAIADYGQENIEDIFKQCLAMAWEYEDENGLDYDYDNERTTDHEESEQDRREYNVDSRQSKVREMVEFIREHDQATASAIGI